METCSPICGAFANISWGWYVLSVFVVFAVGAVWHSKLFNKAWVRVFKVEMIENPKPSMFIGTFLLQFCASAVYGLVFFVLVQWSAWAALLALVGFAAWEKGNLKFQFSTSWSDFKMAAIIRAGYLFLAGGIYILFAMI